LLATCAAQTRNGKEIREDWRREKAVKRHESPIATITPSKSLHHCQHLVKPKSRLVRRLQILSTDRIQKSERNWNFWISIPLSIAADKIIQLI
jgi:hypothetical protein